VRGCDESNRPYVEITAARAFDVSEQIFACGAAMMPSSESPRLTITTEPYPVQQGKQLINPFVRTVELCDADVCETAVDATVVVEQDVERRRLEVIMPSGEHSRVLSSDWFDVCGGDFRPDCGFEGT